MTKDRIFERSIPEPNTGCWLWLGRVKKDGYGLVSTRPYQSAHRLSYQLHCGEIPDGAHVLHSCDQPSCVNPDHLRVGTAWDNAQDKVKRGRMAGPSKLTEEDVKAIRADKRSKRVIAAEFGIHFTTIQRIRNGSAWKRIE